MITLLYKKDIMLILKQIKLKEQYGNLRNK